MFVEGLTVVGSNHYRSILKPPTALQVIEYTSQLLVHIARCRTIAVPVRFGIKVRPQAHVVDMLPIGREPREVWRMAVAMHGVIEQETKERALI